MSSGLAFPPAVATSPNFTRSLRLAIQFELAVHGPQCRQCLLALHEHRHFDLAGGDRFDVDLRIGQRAEHAIGHARLRRHAEADDRNLRQSGVVQHGFGAELLGRLFRRGERLRQIVFEHGERNVGRAVGAGVLHDHVDRHIDAEELRENRVARARLIGHAGDRDFGFVLGEGRPAHGPVGPFRFAADHRARLVAEAGAVAHVNRHVELLAELDRPAVHHAGPQAGQLQNLVVADAVQLASLGHEPRIGREHAVDVGVNLAGVRIQHRRQRHGRRIAAAAAERRDVEILVDALEAGRDDDLAVVEQLLHPLGRDRLNAGLGVRAVGADADLRAGEAHGLGPERMNRHRHQRDAHLLAGREEHIHLAAGRVVGDLLREVDQHIGLMPHRADDHHDLVAILLRANRPPRRHTNLFRIGDTRAAEFLNN